MLYPVTDHPPVFVLAINRCVGTNYCCAVHSLCPDVTSPLPKNQRRKLGGNVVILSCSWTCTTSWLHKFVVPCTKLLYIGFWSQMFDTSESFKMNLKAMEIYACSHLHSLCISKKKIDQILKSAVILCAACSLWSAVHHWWCSLLHYSQAESASPNNVTCTKRSKSQSAFFFFFFL